MFAFNSRHSLVFRWLSPDANDDPCSCADNDRLQQLQYSSLAVTAGSDTALVAQRRRRMQQVHPPYSSPGLVAAPVESVVEFGQAVLVAHVRCVKNS